MNNSGQPISQNSNVLRHLHKMFLLELRMQVFLEIWIAFTPDFYVTDVESIDDLLDGFWFPTRCSRQRKYPEVRVMLHHVTNDLCIRIVAGPPMCLVYYML